jgi:hypothetical protein
VDLVGEFGLVDWLHGFDVVRWVWFGGSDWWIRFGGCGQLVDLVWLIWFGLVDLVWFVVLDRWLVDSGSHCSIVAFIMPTCQVLPSAKPKAAKNK